MNEESLQKYFSKDLKWKWDHQAQLVFKFLCSAAAEARGGVVLDAGAGYQRYKPFFEESIYLAQEHPEAGVQNKQIKQYDILCDVKTIPLRDDCVDVVLSTSSLEHMRYPELFFQSAHRVLVPGGSLHIHVPFVYFEHEVPFDFQRPTRFGLLRWFEDAGFKDVKVLPSSSSIYPAIFFLKKAIREERQRIVRAPRATLKERVKTSPRVLNFLERVTDSYMGLLSNVYERGPFPDTIFPIGWVAIGYKEGTHRQPAIRCSTVDFLKQNASAGAVFSNDCLTA